MIDNRNKPPEGKPMKIGVLTYDVPHRKTQDLLFALRVQGYADAECIALPFEYRNFKPLIHHRPGLNFDIHPRQLCANLGYKYTKRICLDKYDKILIGGAGILGKEFTRYEIINAHPGVLPFTRGLDAMKWAIYEGMPLGVTTHIIDAETDGGLIIDQRFLEVGFFDTFHSIAERLYQMEIRMLVEALTNGRREKIPDLDRYPVRRRMPHDKEVQMFKRFKKLKE